LRAVRAFRRRACTVVGVALRHRCLQPSRAPRIQLLCRTILDACAPRLARDSRAPASLPPGPRSTNPRVGAPDIVAAAAARPPDDLARAHHAAAAPGAGAYVAGTPRCKPVACLVPTPSPDTSRDTPYIGPHSPAAFAGVSRVRGFRASPARKSPFGAGQFT
jgi:hypothetical protein